MVNCEEFSEIASCGGKLTLKFDPESGAVSLAFTHSSPTPAGAFQIGMSLDGKQIEYWPIYGINMKEPDPPSPMVATFVLSDQFGYYGRTCPKCEAYFRTTKPAEIIQCPYCSHRNRNEAFTTENQLKFVDKIRESYITAFEERKDIVIDLDEIAADLPENRPSFVYTEESQQNRYSCPNCKTGYDILGEYAGCPTCGKRNSLQVFEAKLDEVAKELEDIDSEVTDRHDREVAWERLTRCISDFEAMARDLVAQLMLIPTTPKRRRQLEQMNFQNIDTASRNLREWLGFEIMTGIDEGDKQFLVKMAHRRHILTHNAGRVDQEYLDKSGDTTVRLHQKIAVRSKEIKRLITLLRTCATNFFSEFESIS